MAAGLYAADYQSIQMAAIDAGLGGNIQDSGTYNYKMGGQSRHLFRGSLVLATQAKSKSIEMVRLPIGMLPLMCWLNSDTSLSTASIEIGSSLSLAKYRANATFTTVGQWVPFMLPGPTIMIPLVAPAISVIPGIAESIWITNDGTATLPAAGNLELLFECIVP